MPNTENNEAVEPSRLLSLVRAAAISPEDAKAAVSNYMAQAREKHPQANQAERQDIVAKKIVARYARLSAFSGGATALVGVVPGIGTIIAAAGGALGDAALTMKFQVDMAMCLAEAFGYDLNNDDAQNLSLLIAAGGTLEKAGVDVGTRFASKAGVRLLRQYLRGAALVAVKEFFKKLGIVFTRKALEKALPFGIGVAIGAGANFALTKWVGKQAIRWFELDRADGGPGRTLG